MVPENDDTKDSRPPTLEDLVRLCRSLNRHKAKYIIVGGMAMIQHGFVRATQDIDLLIATGKENERTVIDAVSELPDGAAAEIEPGEIEKFEVIRVADEIVVDLMSRACGVDFEEASERIILVKLHGVPLPFADVELMKKLKRSIRPKDKMDLEFLKSLVRKRK